MRVEMFTDGACRGNPGPGGWGVIIRYKDTEKELYGAEAHTTNNRMELQAAISGLRALTRSVEASITTDSVYVQKGITEWIHGWQKNNWRNSKKEEVKNKDLWQELLELVKIHHVQWHWVKGHAGHIENERADQLANLAIDELLEKSS